MQYKCSFTFVQLH